MTTELKVHNVKTVEAETVRYPGINASQPWYATTVSITRDSGEVVNVVVYHDYPINIPHTNRDSVK